MSDKQYLLSICIPTFNRAKYLDVNLRLLSEQIDINKVQIVVSDNFSSDNTKEIVDKYTNLNIKYFKQKENVGFINNFEILPDIADGEYIWFMGDDDIIAFNGVSEILHILKNNNISLYYVNQEVYSEQDLNKRTISISNNKFYKDGRNLFIDVTLTLQFLSAIIVNRIKIREAIDKYKKEFTKDRHIIQLLYIMSKSSSYFIAKAFVLSDYTDKTLKKNRYESDFSGLEMFFNIPNTYVKYAEKNLGYTDIQTKDFKRFQNKQFLKIYIHEKKESNHGEMEKVTISQANNILFGRLWKFIFIVSYITPSFFLKVLWNGYTSCRKVLLGY